MEERKKRKYTSRGAGASHEVHLNNLLNFVRVLNERVWIVFFPHLIKVESLPIKFIKSW